MSDTLARIRELVRHGDFEVSAHALRELAIDGIVIKPLLEAIADAVVVDDYPDYHKGPSVLVLLADEFGRPIHLVWGIPKGKNRPAVLVTAYRPEPTRWSQDFTSRKRE